MTGIQKGKFVSFLCCKICYFLHSIIVDNSLRTKLVVGGS